MVFDGTPLQLVRDGCGNFTTETARTSTAKSAAKGDRAHCKRQPEESAQQKTVRLSANLSLVARDGSLCSVKQLTYPVEPVTLARPSSAPIRILLVDASENDRRACCGVLQEHSPFEVEVLEAETGQDGLQMTLHQALDCILLNNDLPDMSGTEFVAQLAGSIGDAHLPVLNMVEKNNFASLDKAVKYGAHDCLIKDVEGHYLDLLPAIVKRMLDNHHNLKGNRQTEAMYRILIEHIQAITYIVSPQHGKQITFVSPQIEQLGITPNMWTKNPGQHFQYVHEEDREAVKNAFSHTCRSWEAFCQDYRLCCANGVVRWFHDTASVVKDHNGQPMFLQGVMVDITKIKEMEAELEEHRYHLERRVAQRTQEMGRRLAVLESCNATLCNKMEQLRSINARQRQSLMRGQALLKSLGGAVVTVDKVDRIVEMNEEATAPVS